MRDEKLIMRNKNFQAVSTFKENNLDQKHIKMFRDLIRKSKEIKKLIRQHFTVNIFLFF